MLSPKALVTGNPARAKFAVENLFCGQWLNSVIVTQAYYAGTIPLTIVVCNKTTQSSFLLRFLRFIQLRSFLLYCKSDAQSNMKLYPLFVSIGTWWGASEKSLETHFCSFCRGVYIVNMQWFGIGPKLPVSDTDTEPVLVHYGIFTGKNVRCLKYKPHKIL